MGIASVSEYVASLNEEQQRHICTFIEFVNREFPQLTNKSYFSMPRRVKICGFLSGTFKNLNQIESITGHAIFS